MGIIHRVKRFFSELPNKKGHIEFFTALLSVPVLLTIILINLNNLNADKAKEEQKRNQTTIITVPVSPSKVEETPTPSTEVCKPEVGPIEITYPEEESTVSENPVNVSISYKKEGYCAVVWSYRINGSQWSDYDDRSVALYSMPSGEKTFELRVKSLISGETKILTRKFTYKPPLSPTPTTTPVTPAPTE